MPWLRPEECLKHSGYPMSTCWMNEWTDEWIHIQGRPLLGLPCPLSISTTDLRASLDTLLCGAILNTVACLAASFASTHQMPWAQPSCSNQKCLQKLPNIPWGKFAPTDFQYGLFCVRVNALSKTQLTRQRLILLLANPASLKCPFFLDFHIDCWIPFSEFRSYSWHLHHELGQSSLYSIIIHWHYIHIYVIYINILMYIYINVYICIYIIYI